jgi:hypothetical protein
MIEMDGHHEAEFVPADIEDIDGVAALDLHGVNVGERLLHFHRISPLGGADNRDPKFQRLGGTGMLARCGLQKGFFDDAQGYNMYPWQHGSKNNFSSPESALWKSAAQSVEED